MFAYGKASFEKTLTTRTVVNVKLSIMSLIKQDFFSSVFLFSKLLCSQMAVKKSLVLFAILEGKKFGK